MASSRLLALPAELRNEIFELAFTTDNHEDSIDLCRAIHPSKSLLLTCHQVHAEALQIYQDAYRKYWSENTFTIKLNNKHDFARAKERVTILKEDDLQDIQALTITTSTLRGREQITWTATLVDSRGLWLCTATSPSTVLRRDHQVYRRLTPTGTDHWQTGVRSTEARGSSDEAQVQAGVKKLESADIKLATMVEQITYTLVVYEYCFGLTV
ncbi:hypothetical protein CLAFUW4_09742 [Fulvia fulva]|nr:hypothetical protein CLAFUR4_09747 [Fulvia fulva]WPV19719.1 hypothetical protein CLAFUW4_09742 [Fulvia fulva]